MFLCTETENMIIIYVHFLHILIMLRENVRTTTFLTKHTLLYMIFGSHSGLLIPGTELSFYLKLQYINFTYRRVL